MLKRGSGRGVIGKELLGKFPDDDAGGGADVEAVLRTELRDFEAAVALVDNRLLYALHLIAEDEGLTGVGSAVATLLCVEGVAEVLIVGGIGALLATASRVSLK